METTRVFDEIALAYHQGCRGVDSRGGTRSTKTYSALQFLFFLAVSCAKKLVISVVSETLPHLKKGAIRDFEEILRNEGYIAGSLKDDKRWNSSDRTMTFANGTIIEFFSADSPGKVHGPSRDILFINEGQNIRWETANQLMLRTRDFVIVDYNPTHEFWAHLKIATDRRFRTIVSTYKDNRFLTPGQIEDIEKGKEDANWWRVYGLGLTGQLEGVIYEFEQVDEMPDHTPGDNLIELQGLDFGFTNDPTARVRILADWRKRIAWVQQRCYDVAMQNKHIIADLERDGVSPYVPIYADCAEPKSIADIQDAGYNVIACDKDAPVKSDKLKFQLQWMQGWKLYVTKDSLDLIREQRNYTWKKDKDGKPLNEPIDKFNHALDAMRYALWTHFGKEAGSGQYTLSFIKH